MHAHRSVRITNSAGDSLQLYQESIVSVDQDLHPIKCTNTVRDSGRGTCIQPESILTDPQSGRQIGEHRTIVILPEKTKFDSAVPLSKLKKIAAENLKIFFFDQNVLLVQKLFAGQF